MGEEQQFYSRGYLPHWNKPGWPQFLTWRLADALPKSVLDEINRRYPYEAVEMRGERYKATDIELDRGYGSCILRRGDIGRACLDELLTGHGSSYVLEAFVLMPNHVHVLLVPDPHMELGDLVKSLKGRTARAINAKMGRVGRLWQPDYFDRLIRTPEHFERTLKYIEWNPVKAGLCADPRHFRLSSAFPANKLVLQARTEVRGPDAD